MEKQRVGSEASRNCVRTIYPPKCLCFSVNSGYESIADDLWRPVGKGEGGDSCGEVVAEKALRSRRQFATKLRGKRRYPDPTLLQNACDSDWLV